MHICESTLVLNWENGENLLTEQAVEISPDFLTTKIEIVLMHKWDGKSYEICLRNVSETKQEKPTVLDNFRGRKWIRFHNCTSSSPDNLIKH